MNKREHCYASNTTPFEEQADTQPEGISPAAIVAALFGNLENFKAASTSGGIEAQEKAGQIEQSFLETLPFDGTAAPNWRAQFEALGFKFKTDAQSACISGRVPLFVDVEFPKGWRKKCTDHDMHTDLLDDKGRKRAGIFYKATFYDQRADVNLCQRYHACSEPAEGWTVERDQRTGKYVGVVKDCDTVIFKTEPTEPEPAYDYTNELQRPAWLAWLASKEAKAAEARAWLEVKYPHWQNVSAYWD